MFLGKEYPREKFKFLMLQEEHFLCNIYFNPDGTIKNKDRLVEELQAAENIVKHSMIFKNVISEPYNPEDVIKEYSKQRAFWNQIKKRKPQLVFSLKEQGIH